MNSHSTGDAVLLSVEGPIAWLTLNRPEKLNALSHDMLDELIAHLAVIGADSAIRVVILKAAGRAFCSGHDVGGSAPSPADIPVTEDFERIDQLMTRLVSVWDFPKPVIAQVHGFCIGVGSLLPLFCDLTMVAEDARIRWPALPLGGGMIGPLWTWLIGPKKAKEMSFIIGSEITGAEACQWGWANHALPAAELNQATRQLAERIALTPPDLLRIKKLAINDVLERQGFRSTVASGARWDSMAHYGPGVVETRGKMRELGMSQAIQWFKSKSVR